MNLQKIFLDTSYVIALTSKKDIYAHIAYRLSSEVKKVKEVWTHEGILLEIADWLAKYDRNLALNWCERILSEATNIRLQKMNTSLIREGLKFYKKYADKTMGLTDCISFVVMKEQAIAEALTSDRHFQQIGFTALLLES